MQTERERASYLWREVLRNLESFPGYFPASRSLVSPSISSEVICSLFLLPFSDFASPLLLAARERRRCMLKFFFDSLVFVLQTTLSYKPFCAFNVSTRLFIFIQPIRSRIQERLSSWKKVSLPLQTFISVEAVMMI